MTVFAAQFVFVSLAVSLVAAPVDSKRTEAIRQLKVLIERGEADEQVRFREAIDSKAIYRGDSYLPELKFRLAELMRSTASEHEHQNDKLGVQAIALLREVIDDYPEFARRDEVMFRLGEALYGAHEINESLAMFTTLSREYPRSPWVPDAWLRLGEHFFTINQMGRARRAYSMAVAASRARVAEPDEQRRIQTYALYKLAWCDFNRLEHARARDGLIRVFRILKEGAGVQPMVSDSRLSAQVLSDLAAVFAELRAVEEAFDFYEKALGKPGSATYLRELGRRYLESGKNSLSADVFSRLVDRSPLGPDAPYDFIEMLVARVHQGRNDLVRDGIGRFAKRYGAGSEWLEHRLNEPSESVARRTAKAFMLLLVEQHNRSRLTQRPRDFELTRELYETFFDRYPESEERPRLDLQYAEVLLRLGEVRAAAQVYSSVAKVDGEFAEPASRAAVATWQRLRRSGRSPSRGKDLSGVEQDLAIAYERFSRVSLDGDAAASALYASAELHYEHQRYHIAAEQFRAVASRWPSHSLAPMASEWLEIARFNDIRLNREISAPPVDVAVLYEGFVEEFSESPLAMLALYNAMVSYEQAGRLAEVITAAETLLRDTRQLTRFSGVHRIEVPDPSRLREASCFMLAHAYARVGEFEKAAEWYEKYGELYPNGSRIMEARYNSAFMRESLGELSSAFAHYQDYLRRFPTTHDRLVVAWHAGELLEAGKDWTLVEAYFGRFRERFGETRPWRLLCAAFKAQKARTRRSAADVSTKPGWRRLYAMWQRLPKPSRGEQCAREAGAAAALALAELEYREVLGGDASARRGIAKGMGSEPASNLSRLKALERTYKGVTSIGVHEFDVAAFYRLGRIYQAHSSVLAGRSCPRPLKSARCERYRAAQAKRAERYMTLAKQSFAQALHIGREWGVYNEWLLRASDASVRAASDPAFDPPKFRLILAGATSFRRMGEPENAAAVARRWLLEDEKNRDAWSVLALASLDEGKLDLAEALLRNALAQGEKGSKAADVYVNLGVLEERRGRPQEAMKCFEHALTLDAEHAAAHANAGALALRFRDYERARTAYSNVLKTGRFTCDAVLALDYALQGLGMSERAPERFNLVNERCVDHPVYATTQSRRRMSP